MIHIKKTITVSIIFLFFFTPLFSFDSGVDFNEEDFLIDILWRKIEKLDSGKRPKVALVLGGGGARGIAHIGVLRAISKECIPVDLVVGTSVGSLVGAFYCAQVPIEKVCNLAEQFTIGTFSNINYISMFDMLFMDNLFSNQKLEKYMNDIIGNIGFEELKIPLICVATDLNTGEKILLREGSVAFAARASSTIPGIFKPVEYKQRYLIDGGLTENIPVSVAKIFNCDVIIAVSVAADITKNNISTPIEILMQAIYIQGRMFDEYNLDLADIVIRPEVGYLSVLDFKNASCCINKGFIAAKRVIKDIKKIIINKTEEKYLLE
ncbi:MAG: patatin-like phospholipase family protein [Endomicrobium sp.]|nr:patatin-like phospholipase family protein [Endomicrobium sp.]